MNIEEQKNMWSNPNNWKTDGEEWSNYFGTTDNLWNIIYPKIENYLKDDVLEIASGYGRMTKYLLENTKQTRPFSDNLSLVDLNENCIAACQKKFGIKIKEYVINDGKTLDFKNNQFDFVFSYDSFVHMTEDVIDSYMKDIYRILKRDGYAFIHHSFLVGGLETPINNVAGRSNMNPEVFANLVKKYNMDVISQEDFRVSEEMSDTLTIFHKI